MKQSNAKFGFLVLAILFGYVSLIHPKNLPVRIYTSADGLGSSFVNYLARDSRGFMWFCTRDGLSRFDGSQFVTYQIGEQNSQPGVESIFEASDGKYWITTTAGTYRFDPAQLYAQDTAVPTLRAERIFDDRGVMFEDSKGNLWMGSRGLSKIEIQDGKPVATDVDLEIPVPEGTGLGVVAVTESPDGSLWIVTTIGFVRLLPNGQRVYYPGPANDLSIGGTPRLLIDRRGFVWLGIFNTLYVLKPEAIESVPAEQRVVIRNLSPTKQIDLHEGMSVPLPQHDRELFEFRNGEFINNRFSKEMLQASDDSIWMAAEDFLLEFTDKLNVHSSADGLPSVMGDLVEDSAGNIWIAGQSSLARLNRNGMVSYSKEDGTGSDRILSVFAGANGIIHVSTADSNIAAFNGDRFENVRPHMAHNTGHIWTSRPVMQDSRGDWWILTTNKLFRFSGAGRSSDLSVRSPSATYGLENGLPGDGIFQLFEDSRGDVWVSTRGADPAFHGLSRLRSGEKSFERFSELDGLPPNKSPSSFAEDANGDVWLALFESGVYRFDGSKFQALKPPGAKSEISLITDIHFDSHGRLWITSASSGVTEVTDPLSDHPSFVHYDNANGLSSNNIRTVTEDGFGRIYFGTARGVDRLSPETGRVRRFTVADGLPADFVLDSTRDSQGNVWFATNSGVARLTPVPDEKPGVPKVWLGSMRIGGDQYPLSELGTSTVEVNELSHWQNNLQVEFFGIDFHAGEGLRYQYKLEGADADWSQPDADRSVTFANLRPGSYTLLVRGVNSAGATSDSPAVVNFTILSPIWQRWWFVATVAMVIGLGIISLFRYRISNLRRINLALSEAKMSEEQLRKSREERLAEVESVRSRIATDLHDDIGASLTQIAILSEVAQATAAGGNGAVADPLKKITDVSNELVGTMSDIVWAINPTKDHLSDLAQRMRRVAADLLTPKGIAVHFSSREEDRAVTIKTNTRRDVFLIFKESVNNISKHSGARNVHIDVEIESELLLLRIRDDGKGFICGPPSFEDTFSSESPSGNGIRNMRKRASEIGGRFDIDSTPGGGTTSFLSLPLDSGHAVKASD